MADDLFGYSDGTDSETLREHRDARRKISMDRAMLELPQQVAGIPLVRFPTGVRNIPRSIGPGTGRYPFAHLTRELLDSDPKLALNRPQPDVVTPSEIRAEMEQYGPGGGPGRLADLIESQYGRLQNQPSWANANQYANAGASWAMARDDGAAASPLTSTLADEYRKSQHLMSPARAKYMRGPGRRVDVLRNLRQDPERAMYFWDRSSPPEMRTGRPDDLSLARTDFNDPIYQRFGNDNASPFVASSSPIARGLSWMSSVPNALQFYAAESPTWSDAFGKSDVTILAQDRTRSGANQENPVADAPDSATAKEIIARQAELDERAANLLPPPGQNVANSVLKSLYGVIPHVSASAWAGRPLQPGEESRGEPPLASGLVRDGIVLGANYLDGSQLFGLLNPRSLIPELARDLGREAGIEVGLTAAINPSLPDDPVGYVTEGLPSLPMDTDARQAAFDAEEADMRARPQSLYNARLAADPEFVRPIMKAGSGLLNWLRSSSPGARAYGGQPE
ncbi:hypothetical protein EBZ80_09215 [bacterium]|nr:hypothetical protein [bacterium]